MSTASVLVGIFGLQVVIAKDGDGWVAQGIEVDYAVGGESVEDTQKRFEVGLCESIHAHLSKFGHLDNFIIPADYTLWKGLLAGSQEWQHTSVSLHNLADQQLEWPFSEIKFAVPRHEHETATPPSGAPSAVC